jgi:cytosine/adenosine deaminase-related metal-dependent hydrolase
VIAAVAPSLEVADAEVIDATGHLVLPGLVDTHRHTWQSLARGICGDWTLGDYYFGIRLAISPAYTADDVRLGNRLGALDALNALNALNAGVTTLLDFSHCNNTPDHSDAAVLGLRDTGIRAAFCYCFFESSPRGHPVRRALRPARRLPPDRGHLLRLGRAANAGGVAVGAVRSSLRPDGRRARRRPRAAGGR